MATIADLLRPDASKQCVEAAVFMQMAEALSMRVERVKKLVAKYGTGYIYTRTGLVMADSPHLRFKLVNTWGTCVIITDSGTVLIKTPDSIGFINRRERKREYRRECTGRRKENALRNQCRERERMFRDGQTEGCVKHQGKANSLANIGHYINHPSNAFRPQSSQTVFAVINQFKFS